jgi:hypothetical protein
MNPSLRQFLAGRDLDVYRYGHERRLFFFTVLIKRNSGRMKSERRNGPDPVFFLLSVDIDGVSKEFAQQGEQCERI